MRSILTACFAVSLFACGGNNPGDGDGGNGKPDACVGLECDVVNCSAMGMPPTSISGTVFAPNGTLPLNGVNVYVPRDPLPLPAFVEGATCDRCSSILPGGPVAQSTSGEDGTFRIENVPVGANIPLVITTGKWRRVVTIPSVSQCTDNTVGATETSLPKNKAEGEIPKIAITTGDADTLECLVRKLGIADTEIGKSGDDRRIHLYTGDGVASFNGGFPGGQGAIPAANQFWESANNLKAYDIVFLSCEGSQLGAANANKTQNALNAMKEYADLGGRVFASHWHNIWIGGNFQGDPNLAPQVWPAIGINWGNQGNFATGVDVIDEQNNPKGTVFANWMVNVGGSPSMRGELPVTEPRVTVDGVDTTKAERWVYTKNGAGPPGGKPQMFQFTTPNEVQPDQRCGKVVFTDMHVSGEPEDLEPYPRNCDSDGTVLTMTPQEKALAFMFFDIAGCVGGIL